MNGYQKKALQEKLLKEIVETYGDKFLPAATALTSMGGEVAIAINEAAIQSMRNPNFGLNNFLKICNDAAILQLAKRFTVDMPDSSGRFIGESEQDKRELRFNEREFHTEVIAHSKSLFLTGHYVGAVHEACKAYIEALKKKSGSSKDGTDLMSVLSLKGGNIKFNALATDSERNYQQGLDQISRGVVLAFRNVTAHDTAKSLDMSAIEALDMLSTVSLLLKALDKATVSNFGA